ncbi:MAG TPA: transglutaminase domain-containing protein [Gillisia sp.]|nr:transglutaminase domain-containing protein [Gillisia sp.]
MQKIFTILFLIVTGLSPAQDFKFGKVSIEEVQEKEHSLEPEANAAILYRSVNTYYEYNRNAFTLVTDVHERIKIYNKDGFDYANKEVSSYENGSSRETVTGIKGYTYNIVNGKLEEEKLRKNGIFEEDVSKYNNKTKFTMPNVAEGSVIEYQYTLRSPFVTTIDDIVFQDLIPINKMEASVTIPEFLNFKKHVNPRSPIFLEIVETTRNFNHTSTTVTRGSGKVVNHNMETSTVEYFQNVYSISKDNIPSLKTENYLDHLYNYAAVLKWELQFTKFPNSAIENYSQSWEGVAKSIYNNSDFEGELNKSNYYSKDLEQLLAGTTGETQKAEKIFEYVKSKITWNNTLGYTVDNGVSKAYKEGVGNVADINLMLTSMLKKAGLEAYPVLVSTKNNGIPIFPTRKGFNYVIAGAKVQGDYVLLDATDPMASFNELPARARNWNGRMLTDKENSVLVDLMPQVQSLQRATINLQIDEDFSLKGKSLNLMDGLYAKSYRDKYQDINKDDYLGILEKDKGNIQITNVEIENAEKIGEEIKETYSFELQNGLEVINDKLYLKPLLFAAVANNPFKEGERMFPIIFDFPSIENCTVNIMVPPGYEVESLPESSIYELNNGAGTFKFLALQNGNFLRVESVLDLKNIVYSPQDYDALKKFYAQMVEKHSELIVLKRI